jgi:hypothetical protein
VTEKEMAEIAKKATATRAAKEARELLDRALEQVCTIPSIATVVASYLPSDFTIIYDSPSRTIRPDDVELARFRFFAPTRLLVESALKLQIESSLTSANMGIREKALDLNWKTIIARQALLGLGSADFSFLKLYPHVTSISILIPYYNGPVGIDNYLILLAQNASKLEKVKILFPLGFAIISMAGIEALLNNCPNLKEIWIPRHIVGSSLYMQKTEGAGECLHDRTEGSELHRLCEKRGVLLNLKPET